MQGVLCVLTCIWNHNSPLEIERLCQRETLPASQMPHADVPHLKSPDKRTSAEELRVLLQVTDTHIKRQGRHFLTHAAEAVEAQEQWKEYAGTLTDQ